MLPQQNSINPFSKSMGLQSSKTGEKTNAITSHNPCQFKSRFVCKRRLINFLTVHTIAKWYHSKNVFWTDGRLEILIFNLANDIGK